MRVHAGLAGVYDLAKHFDFEANRQVEELSTMKVPPPPPPPPSPPAHIPSALLRNLCRKPHL